MQFIYYY